MAKNGLFSTVFGNFDQEESGITPTSPTYIDSVGENGTFETYLTEFPVGGCWGVRKNWFLGIGGPYVTRKLVFFGHIFWCFLAKIRHILTLFNQK